MGSYNQIMSAARAVQAHRRALRIDAPHAKDREEASFPFVCPECGEGSAVPAGCPRCDVEMRDVNKTVQLARHADVRDATTRDGTMAAFGVGVVIGVPLLLFLGALSMDAADLPGLGIPAFVWFLLAAVVLGGASSVRLHQQLAPILAGRRERARLRTLATDRAKRARRSRAATAKEHLAWMASRVRSLAEDARPPDDDPVARAAVERLLDPS